MRWNLIVPAKEDGLYPSAVGDGLVYLVSGAQDIFAFDTATGASRWRAQAVGGRDSPPAEGEAIVYTPALGGSLGPSPPVAGPAMTEALQLQTVAMPLVASKVVYLSADDSNVYARSTALTARSAGASPPTVSPKEAASRFLESLTA